VRLLTASQIADRLQVSRSLVYRKAAKGEIPSIHIGSLLRFDPQDVSAWLKGGLGDGTDEAERPVGRDRRPAGREIGSGGRTV
jgi:excisionase family DNA binding protein